MSRRDTMASHQPLCQSAHSAVYSFLITFALNHGKQSVFRRFLCQRSAAVVPRLWQVPAAGHEKRAAATFNITNKPPSAKNHWNLPERHLVSSFICSRKSQASSSQTRTQRALASPEHLNPEPVLSLFPSPSAASLRARRLIRFKGSRGKR